MWSDGATIDNWAEITDISRFEFRCSNQLIGFFNSGCLFLITVNFQPTAIEMKFHKDDLVVVISGKDKGVKGKIKSIDRQRDMLIVEGVNKSYKHVKPSQKNPQGGRLHKETPIYSCKVMLVCPKTGKATRIGYRYLPDGSKERYARVSDTSLGAISPPNPKYASIG